MKHVVNSNEVAHLWAHKTQSDARGGNIYFEGDTIYSYGSHFPIARHVKTKRGEPAILFTTATYSHTTAQHCGMVRGAIPPGVPVFNVNLRQYYSERSALEEYQSSIDEALRNAATARGRAPHYLARAAELVTEANAFSAAFALRRRFKMPGDLTAIRAAVKAEAARQAVKTKRENAALQVKREEKLNAWLGTSGVAYVHGQSYLRVAGEEVETSSGARVPLEHVKAALPIVLRLLAAGKTYEANGHTIHIGHYKLDKIEADGTVVARCHRFSKQEVLRFAVTL